MMAKREINSRCSLAAWADKQDKHKPRHAKPLLKRDWLVNSRLFSHNCELVVMLFATWQPRSILGKNLNSEFMQSIMLGWTALFRS